MGTLLTFATYEMAIFLAALMALVGYRLLTGGIITKGLLSEKTASGVKSFSASRLQLLMITVALAFYVFGQILDSIARGHGEFPKIETKWLLILGGSHSIFLGGKGLSLLIDKLKSNNNEGD